MHSGNPEDPHAELTSGLCSNGYINCSRVLAYTNLCQIFALQAVRRLRERCHLPIDWVVSSDHAAVVFGKDVANILGCKFEFTEKGPDKTQVWKRQIIEPNEIVLQVEELITTAQTTLAVREGIRQGNPYPVNFAPFVLTFIHRSEVYQIENAEVLYVAHFDIWSLPPEECPLCQQGPPRLRPKEHWAELTKQS